MHFIQIGEWTFDSQAQKLIQGEEEVQLEPISSDLLLCLVNHHGDVVSKDLLIEHVWKNRIVSDSAITRVISLLRKHLKDDPVKPVYIRTIHKQGYSLLPEITEVLPDNIDKHHTQNHKIKFNSQSIFVLALFIVLSIIAYRLVMSPEQIVVLNDEYTITPEISAKGKQKNLALSHNEKWLLYSHQVKNEEHFNLYIKNLHNGKINQLTSGKYNDIGASFSFDDSEIYFVRIIKNESCKIMHLSLMGFSEHKEQEIVQCNRRLNLNNVEVHPNNNDLFFIDYQEPVGFGIYRYSNKNKSYQLVANKAKNQVIDYYHKISPDGKNLIVLRSDKLVIKIVLIHLTREDEEQILWSSNSGGVDSVSWSDDSQSIYVNNNRTNKLVNINIQSKKRTTINIDTFQLTSFTDQTENGALYARSGFSSQLDINAVNISGNDEVELKSEIESSANDYSAVQLSAEKLFFISNRSGIAQFYLKDENEVEQQLTNFTNNQSYIHLDAHPNGTTVIGTANARLFSFNINTLKIVWLNDASQQAYAPFYNESGDIFFLKDNKYQTNVYQYIDEKNSNLLLEDVGRAQWLKDELLYQKTNGVVYRYNFSTKKTSQETYGLAHPGRIKRMWVATEEGIYYIRGGNYAKRGIYFKANNSKKSELFITSEPNVFSRLYYDKFNQRLLFNSRDNDLNTKVIKINLVVNQ
jgi:DNA-binding winged helix-turn-helix (wHTH) protein/Tol biopolymer transport system component